MSLDILQQVTHIKSNSEERQKLSYLYNLFGDQYNREMMETNSPLSFKDWIESKRTVCPYCGSSAINTVMPESGVNHPIWKCTKNKYHWGSR